MTQTEQTEQSEKTEQAEINRLKSENEQLKQQLTQKEKAKNAEYVENLVKQGRVFPANKEQITELLNYALDYDNGEVLNFNEGESLLGKLKNYLDTQPTLIHLNRELAGNDDSAFSDNLQYSENVPKEAVTLDKRIRAYMWAHHVDYQTAFNAIHSKGEKQ